MGLRELVRLTLGSAHARGGDLRDVPGCPASVRRPCEQNKGGLGKSARAPRRRKTKTKIQHVGDVGAAPEGETHFDVRDISNALQIDALQQRFPDLTGLDISYQTLFVEDVNALIWAGIRYTNILIDCCSTFFSYGYTIT